MSLCFCQIHPSQDTIKQAFPSSLPALFFLPPSPENQQPTVFRKRSRLFRLSLRTAARLSLLASSAQFSPLPCPLSPLTWSILAPRLPVPLLFVARPPYPQRSLACSLSLASPDRPADSSLGPLLFVSKECHPPESRVLLLARRVRARPFAMPAAAIPRLVPRGKCSQPPTHSPCRILTDVTE